MYKRFVCITSLICLSLFAEKKASNSSPASPPPAKGSTNSPSWLYAGAYGGYSVISGGYRSDGNVAQARFAIGGEAPIWMRTIFGIEAGVQSGNQMRLKADPSIIALTGGLPIQVTIKPFVDFLATAKWQMFRDRPFYHLIKGGIAYRQLQLNDRSSGQANLGKVNGEVQAGLAYQATRRARLVAYYQGIYSGSKAGVNVNAIDDITLSRIPTQQGGFLGVEFSL